MDYGHEQTDKILKELEKKIKKEYSQASKEVEKSMLDYLKRFEENDNEMLSKLHADEITIKEYTEWRTKQMIITDKWEKQRDQLAETYMNADRVASELIKGTTYEAYALNHNYGTFEAENGAKVDTSYTLYSKDTVSRLVKDDPQLLPKIGKTTSEKIRRGELKKWNEKQIQSVMMQGVLQGESIPKIAKRLATTVGEKNAYSHIRAARTMTTSAENAGRIDSYKRAEAMGIKMKKQWLATQDNRTRHSHLLLDGESVPINEKFSNGLMFPADPDGAPAEVYNCRCTLIADLDSIEAKSGINIDSELGKMNYDEWEKNQSVIEKDGSLNRFGESINYSDAITHRHPEVKQLVEDLADEFETKVKEVSVGNIHDKAGGIVQISGTIMKVSDFSDLSSTIHEFAHTISIQDQTKFGLYDEADFWKEIKKVRRAYKKNVGNDSSRWISRYANKNDDEFLAESFAHAIMHEKHIELPSKYGTDYEYSNEVLKIVRKYFGKRKRNGR